MLKKVLNWVFIIAVIASLIYLRVDYQNQLNSQLAETEKALTAVQNQMIENKEQIALLITNMNEKMENLIKECNQLKGISAPK